MFLINDHLGMFIVTLVQNFDNSHFEKRSFCSHSWSSWSVEHMYCSTEPYQRIERVYRPFVPYHRTVYVPRMEREKKLCRFSFKLELNSKKGFNSYWNIFRSLYDPSWSIESFIYLHSSHLQIAMAKKSPTIAFSLFSSKWIWNYRYIQNKVDSSALQFTF